MRTITKISFIASLLYATSCLAVERYRWVDAEGHTHINNSASTSRQTTEKDLCNIKMKKYKAALACFSHYKTVYGATKAEGFKHCPEVLQPNCSP